MYLNACLLIVLSVGVIQAKGNVKMLLIYIISQVKPTSTKTLNPENQLSLLEFRKRFFKAGTPTDIMVLET